MEQLMRNATSGARAKLELRFVQHHNATFVLCQPIDVSSPQGWTFLTMAQGLSMLDREVWSWARTG